MAPEGVTAPVVPWLLAALAVAALTHGYLWRRLFHDTRMRGAFGLVVGAVLLPTGMLCLLYMRVLPLAWSRPAMWVCFTYVGLLFFLLLGSGMIDLVTAFAPRSVRRSRVQATLVVSGAVALSLVSMRIALAPVQVHEVIVTAPAALDGYRVVQLGDLHVGAMRGRTFVAEIVATVNAARPDLVVITGDLVDGTPEQLLGELAPLRDLTAPVYFVLGNHEHLSGADAWRRALPTLGIHVLSDERVPIGTLDLLGLDDERTPARQAALASRGRYTIALAHEPRDVREVQGHGIAVQLSGHTHGGQLFPLHVLERWNQGYLAGSYRVGDTLLLVSEGTGFWGPPMRLGSHPAIELLVLRKGR